MTLGILRLVVKIRVIKSARTQPLSTGIKFREVLRRVYLSSGATSRETGVQNVTAVFFPSRVAPAVIVELTMAESGSQTLSVAPTVN
jgi:hypothetical protein